ncbi:MAG TPA: HlyD family secretion protein [Gemmatimonadaceae bacterium]|nr:HlyD family secretion protein [Gemmatimonadaceae bacterium]
MTAPQSAPATGTEDTKEPPNPIARVVMIVIVLAAVALGGRWGYHKYVYGRSHVSTDDAQVDGHIVPVLAKVGGYVKGVSVSENDHVTAGQPLVRIDAAEYQQRLDQASAEERAAAATAGTTGTQGQAEALVASARGERASLDAQIAAAEVQVRARKADLARAEELAQRQIISRAQLDAARTADEAAAANVEALRRQAAAADAAIANAEAGVRLARAKLDAARASRDNAALSLTHTSVTAPEGGFVSRKQVEVGQLVQAGQPLMAIVADSGVWVTANFKETQLADVRVGQPVEIDVDAYDGCKAEGKVEGISAATGAKFSLLPPDNATGNFTKVVQRVPVRIHVTQGCGDGRPMRPGMSVVARVDTR